VEEVLVQDDVTCITVPEHAELGGFALVLLVSVSVSATIRPVLAQNAPPGPPNLPPGAPTPPSCGWNTPAKPDAVVASSPPGSAVAVTIGEPSWEQYCVSSSTPGGGGTTSSFPAYEVFPIAIQASANTAITLQTGQAVPTAQQVAEGIHNASIWTWFNPGTVETDSAGLARSNLTLAGAVMPFVPNDIANVSLPIVASASTGVNGSAGLPIEFEGGVSAILHSVGPITFGMGIQVQAGNSASPRFDVVYSPPGWSNSTPLQVSMKVLGTYQNGSIGSPPPDVRVSFPQQTLELPPHSIVYFNVDETNSLKPSNATGVDTYTFAVQEKVANNTYVVPLTVSVSLQEVIFNGGAGAIAGAAPAGSASNTTGDSQTAGRSASQTAAVEVALAIVALVAALAIAVGLKRAKAATGPVEPTQVAPQE
jgi:hypothetical protein